MTREKANHGQARLIAGRVLSELSAITGKRRGQENQKF